MAHDDSAPERAVDNSHSNQERIDVHEPAIRDSLERYWVSNVRIMATLTLVWLLVGLGCGVLFADWLNQFHLVGSGYPLGFWFAQQGSIMAFVVIILVYCLLMNRLDRKHHRELQSIRLARRVEQ